MPIYEYKCEKCEKHFDVIQKFSDDPLTTHEDCGGALEKLVSPPAFHFKGSGWYVTDYAKSNGSSPASKNEGGGESKSEGHSDSKSESKQESKPDSKKETKAEAPKPAAVSSDSK